MKSITISIFLLLQFLIVSSSAVAADYTNSLLFKVSVWQNGEETEFEYENPSHYEWEKGSTVIKGLEAQQSVKRIFNQLQVSNQTKARQIKASLEKNGFTDLDRFVVRWIDPKGNLYTWHWEKEEAL
jgi:hypothetical protein